MMGKHHHLQPIHQAGGEEWAVHRDAAVGAQRDRRLRLQAWDGVERVLPDDRRVRPSQRLLQRPGDHDLSGRVERRERRVLFRRGEARHQAVGVRPEHQRLIFFGVGPEPLLEQLGAFLAQ